MINNKYVRATTNLAMLEFAARKLGKLNNKVVYLGGCAAGLYINDPLSLDVRPTLDVDCIIDVVSLMQYHKFEKELTKIGFKKSMEDNIICRWRYDDMILDVMPTDEKILGFGNCWYKEALECSVIHQIAHNLTIKSVTAPYFLATKIEAFRTRGNNDLWSSHDFEDIIAIIAGRLEIVEEIALASYELRLHLKLAFEEIMRDDQFEQVLPGHLNDGPVTVTLQRVQGVKERMRKIMNLVAG